jgi:hypothetical protein
MPPQPGTRIALISFLLTLLLTALGISRFLIKCMRYFVFYLMTANDDIFNYILIKFKDSLGVRRMMCVSNNITKDMGDRNTTKF